MRQYCINMYFYLWSQLSCLIGKKLFGFPKFCFTTNASTALMVALDGCLFLVAMITFPMEIAETNINELESIRNTYYRELSQKHLCICTLSYSCYSR